MSGSGDDVHLRPVERLAVALGRFTNERELPKRLQRALLVRTTQTWVSAAVGPRVYVDNADWLLNWDPDRGVVFAGNHRSFFDQWVNMLCLFEGGARFLERIYFPVRSSFFYEHAGGMLVNYMIGFGAMYPPIFRDRDKAMLNRDAVDRLIRFLARPGTVVGVHPEGRRNKGPDPYELLPAQPGVGEIILKSKARVVPFFVSGLSNSFFETVSTSHRASRHRTPITLIYGDELDLSEFEGQKPRAALYKRVSDRVRAAIVDLMPRERELRARCESGDIAPDDPGWLHNLIARKTGSGAPPA